MGPHKGLNKRGVYLGCIKLEIGVSECASCEILVANEHKKSMA